MSHQMNHPPVVELENIAGCRYMLVTAVAKAVDELYNGELCVRYPAEYYQTSEK